MTQQNRPPKGETISTEMEEMPYEMRKPDPAPVVDAAPIPPTAEEVEKENKETAKPSTPLVYVKKLDISWKGDAAGDMLDAGASTTTIATIREHSYTSSMIRVPELIAVAKIMKASPEEKLPESDKPDAIYNLLKAMKRYHYSQGFSAMRIYFPEELLEKAKKGEIDASFRDAIEAYSKEINQKGTLNMAGKLPSIILGLMDDKPFSYLTTILESYQKSIHKQFGKDIVRNPYYHRLAVDGDNFQTHKPAAASSPQQGTDTFIETIDGSLGTTGEAVFVTTVHQGALTGVTEQNISLSLMNGQSDEATPTLFLPDMAKLRSHEVTNAEDHITISGSGTYDKFTPSATKTREVKLDLSTLSCEERIREIYDAAKTSRNPDAQIAYETGLLWKELAEEEATNEADRQAQQMRRVATRQAVLKRRAENSQDPEEALANLPNALLTGKETLTEDKRHVANYHYEMRVPKNHDNGGLPLLPGLIDIEPEYHFHYEAIDDEAALPIDSRFLESGRITVESCEKLNKTSSLSVEDLEQKDAENRKQYIEKPKPKPISKPTEKPLGLWARFTQWVSGIVSWIFTKEEKSETVEKTESEETPKTPEKSPKAKKRESTVERVNLKPSDVEIDYDKADPLGAASISYTPEPPLSSTTQKETQKPPLFPDENPFSKEKETDASTIERQTLTTPDHKPVGSFTKKELDRGHHPLADHQSHKEHLDEEKEGDHGQEHER